MDVAEFALLTLQVLSALLLAGLAWLAARLAALIRVHVANQRLRGVLLRLDDAATRPPPVGEVGVGIGAHCVSQYYMPVV